MATGMRFFTRDPEKKSIDAVSRPVEDRVLFVAIIFSLVIAWFVSFKPIPFSNPDEGAHFFRSLEVSHGHLINFPGQVGIEIPCSEYFLIGIRYFRVANHQDVLSRTDFGKESCRVKTVNTAGAYSPVPYVFTALAELIGRQFNWSVEKRLVAMRFANFAGTTAICAVAFLLLSTYRAPFVLIALSPLVLWLRASVSADAMTIAMSMLFIAYTFSIFRNMRVPGLRQWSVLLFLAVVLGSCKQVYALLCFSTLLFWLRDRGSDSRKLKLFFLCLLPGAVAILASLFWTVLADPALIFLGNSAQPRVQLLGMVTAPHEFMLAVGRMIVLQGWDFVRELWTPYLIISQPAGVAIATLMTVLFCIVVGSGPLPPLSRSERTFCTISGLVVCLVVTVPLYLTFTAPHFPAVLGVQGRYFIPPLMLLALGVMGLARGFLTTSVRFREVGSSVVPLMLCVWVLLKYFVFR